MPRETLLSAARRAQRFFSIDMEKGGLITNDTELAFDLLRKELEKATNQIKDQGHLTITFQDTFGDP